MKKIPLIVVVVFSLAFAGLADAAPKKRTRNQNRIGPYGAAFVGMTSYSGDHSSDEEQLLDLITGTNIPTQNASVSTEDTDIGYQAAFGYRFNRYIAAEVGLAQYGDLTSKAKAELDFPNDTDGFIPASVSLNFSVGGPVFSAVGILPINDKFEVYARLGFLFASVEREFVESINGDRGVAGSAKGDSQVPVYGAGLTWNINQMYSVRAEYNVISDVGEDSRTGTEDLSNLSLGIVVRF